MKKIFLKWSMFAFMLMYNVAIFAQVEQDNPTGDQEGDDDSSPINSKLIFLAIAGVMFAFYYFNKMHKSRKEA